MAHVTDLGFTMDELHEAMAAGDIRRQTHPEFPELAIYNYGEEVQYRNKWNRITLACRGLILDTVTGEVIARPWEKFFNFGQRDNRIDSDAPVEVTDKMDGSLGILYRRPDGKFAIATRGSFASEQALHATKLWGEEYAMYHDFNELIGEYTFLFEIIAPWNRIVCNYGDMDDLVLLGAVNKEQGYYLGPNEAMGILGWTGPVTEMFHADNFVSALSLPDRAGKEGYIIRSGRNIVKLKQSDYLIAHRVVTNLSPKFVWERLAAGDSVEKICDGIPDEFYHYVKELATPILSEFDKVKQECYDCFNKITERVGSNDRKMFALESANYPHRAAMFSLLDGKDIDGYVWKRVKPNSDAVLSQVYGG